MADSDLEIDVTDVEDGVEVQTIIQGQAPVTGTEEDLEFMVQEEVETTTEGDTLTVELDPVDNVIIALQESDANLEAGGHFDFGAEQNGDLDVQFRKEFTEPGEDGGRSPAKKKRGIQSRSIRNSGGMGVKKKPRKTKKGSICFTNRLIPAALSGAGVAKEAVREANETSFDPEKEPRKWKKRRIPVKTVDGGKFCVSMWCSGRSLPKLPCVSNPGSFKVVQPPTCV